MCKYKAYFKALTLVELLVALMVTSIILAAAATFAHAFGVANEVTGDISNKQSQIRYATLRISELIKHSKLICGAPGSSLAIWRADDNGNGQINPAELVYLERGASGNYIRLMEFPTTSSLAVTLSGIRTGLAKVTLLFFFDERYTYLVPECSDVQFQLDAVTPASRFVNISFDLVENGVTRQFQLSSTVRGWAGNLLDDEGDDITGDDD